MRVLVFGDSITYGAWDTNGGWADRLKSIAHKKTVESQGTYKLQVINLGIGGDTSTKIRMRMVSEIAARYSVSWPLVLVMAFGTNDERSTNGTVETSLEQFEDNVKEIISIAKKNTGKILFVGVPPLGQPLVLFKNQEYSDERIKTYEQRLRGVVAASGLSFVPIRPVFEKTGLENLYAYDYLHPNDVGHKLIVDTVWPALEEMLA